jgi:hypothetical protein
MLRAMRSTFFATFAAIGTALVSPAYVVASEFDVCVLQHMQGTTSDLGALSIKEACLRTTETPLPSEVLQTLGTARAAFGKLPFSDGGFGLFITLNNNTGYTITELTIGIEEKKTQVTVPYVVRTFPFVPPPGVIISGLPKDPTILKMIGPGQRQFYTPITETTRDAKNWGEAYDWMMLSAKGFRN